ncbi:hypothetical protein ACFSSD_05235 [Sphingobacterium griseoflavum]
MKSAQIWQVEKIDLDTVLMTCVNKAFKDKGQMVIPSDMDHIVNNLIDMVLEHCPFIRIGEIPIAIEKGILGDYGDYFGLNVVTFTNFIKTHYASQNRANLAKQAIVRHDEIKEPTESEVLEQDKILLKSAFEKFKSSGRYEDHGNYLYKVAAKKLNLFELSPERQKEYLEQGKIIAIEKLKNEQIQRPNERKRISKIMDQANNLEKGSDGVKLVYKESLQIALTNWFKELIEMDAEITDLLTD